MKNAWRRVLALTALLFACSHARGANAAATRPSPASDRLVVMISLDGLAAHYFDDPNCEMPTLRALAASGARATGMRASTPTVTWPNHATLMTGCEPARHGVVGNNYLDRATGKHVVLIADPEFDKAELVKVPTIYDAAKRAGLKTAAIRWPASRNADTLDWQMPDVGKIDLVRKYTTPALLDACRAAGIHLEAGVDSKLAPEGKAEPRDVIFTKAFNFILREHRPNLGLLHLADVDHTQHLHGPNTPEAYAEIKEADALVRDVWEQMQRTCPGRSTIVIVSDHGFSAIEQMLFPNVLLRQAGLIEVKGIRQTGGNVRIVPQGGVAMVYLTYADDAERASLVERVTKTFTGVEGYSSVVQPAGLAKYGVADPKTDPHAPDMLIFAKMGRIFGDTAAGDLPFRDKPERKGSHGHDPDFPELHATFIASGYGIKPGTTLGQISNTAVAPTLAALLNVDLPNTDGKPLTAALTGGSADR